jgi:glycosyltransferase involved in cell wall biosynthesis
LIRVTIVVPVYQEERNVQALYERLEKVTSSVPHVHWEYLFVNDGSRDQTYEILKSLAAHDSKVKALTLTRNFGKEIALSAGAHAANSEAIVCIDADLQHPPELIPEMIEEWKKGADVVIAVRRRTDQEPLMRRLGSYLFYKAMKWSTGLELTPGTTDFRLIDKKVLNVFREMTERARLFRGLVDWMGFQRRNIYFDADARFDGHTSFSYRRLWNLAINSLTSFSLLPLRLTAYIGCAITLCSGLLLTRMLMVRFFSSVVVYTPLAIVVVINTLLMGIVLMAIGLVGFYIGVIHTEVINRPLYIVRDRLNFGTHSYAERRSDAKPTEQLELR